MSQLRNLLTNKILRHNLGSGSAVGYHRRQIQGLPKRRRELAELNAARNAAMQARAQSMHPAQSKRPGLLGRFLNTVRKALGA